MARILHALGLDVSSEAACAAALAEHDLAPWRELLAPTVVMREGSATSVAVHVPDGATVRVWVIDEAGHEWTLTQGEDWEQPRDVDGQRTGRATFWLPEQLPQGWHHCILNTSRCV